MEEKNILSYVLNLARIRLSKEEEEVLKDQFANILKYVDQLKKVKVEGIEPMRVVHAGYNIFREDKAIPFSDREMIIKNAPAQEGGCFKVPSVI